MTLQIRSIADLKIPPPPAIKVMSDHYILNGDYPVEFSDVDTAEKIIAWALHLAEKVWFDRHLQRAFMIAAGQRIGLAMYKL